MLNESSINCFLSLAETLSFTESARRLYLTQQAVSRNIMQLEAELDLPLVNRDGRVITLTPAGERCAVLFRDLSRRFTEGMDAIRREMDTEVRSVRAGFQNFLDFGAELFHSNELFRQRCPEAILKVERHSPGTLTKRLYSGALDLAVMHRRYAPTNPDYEIRDLFTVHLNILVSPNHPNVNESATYLDFRTQPFIIDVFEDERRGARSPRQARDRAHRLRPLRAHHRPEPRQRLRHRRDERRRAFKLRHQPVPRSQPAPLPRRHHGRRQLRLAEKGGERLGAVVCKYSYKGVRRGEVSAFFAAL